MWPSRGTLKGAMPKKKPGGQGRDSVLLHPGVAVHQVPGLESPLVASPPERHAPPPRAPFVHVYMIVRFRLPPTDRVCAGLTLLFFPLVPLAVREPRYSIVP